MGKYSSLFCSGIYAGDRVVHKLPLMWVAIWMKISNITYEIVGWVIWRLCYPAFSDKKEKFYNIDARLESTVQETERMGSFGEFFVQLKIE